MNSTKAIRIIKKKAEAELVGIKRELADVSNPGCAYAGFKNYAVKYNELAQEALKIIPSLQINTLNIRTIPNWGDSFPHTRKSILLTVEQEMNNLVILLEAEMDEVTNVVSSTDVNTEETSESFSNRLKKVIEEFNRSLDKQEKDITLEKVACLLGMNNSNELIEYTSGKKEPDFGIKRRISDMFGTNEEWMVTGVDNPHYLNRIKFLSYNPLDLLKDESLSEFKFIVVFGIEGDDVSRKVIIICKESETKYRIIDRQFNFDIDYGQTGLMQIAQLALFFRKGDDLHRFHHTVYILPEGDFNELWRGKIYPKRVIRYKSDEHFLYNIYYSEEDAWNVGYFHKRIDEKKKDEIEKKMSELIKDETYENQISKKSVKNSEEETGLTTIQGKNRSVFVTYAWIDEEYNNKVKKFCQMLRNNGYSAEMDTYAVQQQTAIDLNEMMSRGFEKEKVIVFLSKEYKSKADKYSGGVGKEYRMLANEIDKDDRKFIFVTLDDGIDVREKIPRFLGNREVIILSSKREEWESVLYSKLADVPIFEFGEVNEEMTIPKTKKVSGNFCDDL